MKGYEPFRGRHAHDGVCGWRAVLALPVGAAAGVATFWLLAASLAGTVSFMAPTSELLTQPLSEHGVVVSPLQLALAPMAFWMAMMAVLARSRGFWGTAAVAVTAAAASLYLLGGSFAT